jgi:hypothetical protein
MRAFGWALVFCFCHGFAIATEVSKAEWVESMKISLPAAFCQSSQYFRQCFDVSAQECEEVASSATRLCLNKHINDIPQTLVQPRDGSRWGAIVGGCVGQTYEALLITKRTASPKCDNPANWWPATN